MTAIGRPNLRLPQSARHAIAQVWFLRHGGKMQRSAPIANLNRRHLLTAGAVFSCVALNSATEAFADAANVLRLALTNGAQSQTAQMARAFASELWKQSDGRIRVEIFFGGALGGEKEISEDVATGVLDLAIVSSAGYATNALAPTLGVFDIPFLFRDLKHARAVLDGPIGNSALADLEAANVIGLSWGENGVRQITTRDRPVRTPEDLIGIKIRVPQSDVMVAGFKALGADARPLPFPDLYAALANGSFDAQENPVGNIKNGNFDRVQKYLSLTNHIYSPALLMMSKASFDRLSPEDQRIVRIAARNAAPVSRSVNDSNDKSDIDELHRRGMEVITDVDREAFIRAVRATRGQFSETFGENTLNAIEAFGS